MSMSELQTGQQEIFDYVKNNLGDGMIDVELDPKHYQTALERAINKFRQRSSNAVEESYAFLELKKDQNTYILQDEITVSYTHLTLPTNRQVKISVVAVT